MENSRERNFIMKDKITVEDYKVVGAQVKLMKGSLSNIVRLLSGKVPKSLYMPQIYKIEDALRVLGSNLEDRMFHDYPDLSNEYLHVFYGADIQIADCEADGEQTGCEQACL